MFVFNHLKKKIKPQALEESIYFCGRRNGVECRAGPRVCLSNGEGIGPSIEIIKHRRLALAWARHWIRVSHESVAKNRKSFGNGGCLPKRKKTRQNPVIKRCNLTGNKPNFVEVWKMRERKAINEWRINGLMWISIESLNWSLQSVSSGFVVWDVPLTNNSDRFQPRNEFHHADECGRWPPAAMWLARRWFFDGRADQSETRKKTTRSHSRLVFRKCRSLKKKGRWSPTEF